VGWGARGGARGAEPGELSRARTLSLLDTLRRRRRGFLRVFRRFDVETTCVGDCARQECRRPAVAVPGRTRPDVSARERPERRFGLVGRALPAASNQDGRAPAQGRDRHRHATVRVDPARAGESEYPCDRRGRRRPPRCRPAEWDGVERRSAGKTTAEVRCRRALQFMTVAGCTRAARTTRPIMKVAGETGLGAECAAGAASSKVGDPLIHECQRSPGGARRVTTMPLGAPPRAEVGWRASDSIRRERVGWETRAPSN
jgi:hypothetical protein